MFLDSCSVHFMICSFYFCIFSITLIVPAAVLVRIVSKGEMVKKKKKEVKYNDVFLPRSVLLLLSPLLVCFVPFHIFDSMVEEEKKLRSQTEIKGKGTLQEEKGDRKVSLNDKKERESGR